ncbi:MAG: hypothetical protein QMD14_05975 [Candidatus Aenigmarchaeota archaeon]|nr:hypothetical protein [Candidatus Aenigmarchaeota archaeon]
MSRKGIVLLTKTVVETLGILALFLFVIFLFIGRHLELDVIMNETSYKRNGIILANVISAYPRLIVVENGRMLKGVFDSEKIEEIDKKLLYEEISYPGTTYTITINSITGKTWEIEEDDVKFEEKFRGKFPIAIKEDGGIKAGVMEIVFGERK